MSATWRVLETGDTEPDVGIGFRAIASLIKVMAERIHAAHRLRRAGQLGHLGDHLLRDIGVRPTDLQRDGTDLREIADRLMMMSNRRWHL